MEWILYVAFMITVGGEKCLAPIRLHRLCTEFRKEADNVKPSGWADRTVSEGTASHPLAKTSNARWVVIEQTEDEQRQIVGWRLRDTYANLELPAL